jgi:hypothetical protein
MNTLHRSLLLVGVGAALVPGLGRAQIYPDHPYALNLSHPAGYVTGDARAVVLGQLTDDAIPDACVLHGTEAFLLRSVDRRNRWRALSESYAYTEIALLPHGQSQNHDGVLAVTSSGLVKLLWNGSSGVETLVPQSVSGSSAWAGATEVQVARNDAGAYEALGLASDGTTILRWSYNTATGAMADLGAIELNNEANALTPVNWNTDDEFEYAAAGAWGCGVYTSQGERVVPDVEFPSNGSKLLRLNDGDGDRLVWVTSLSSTASFLRVLRSDDVEENPIYLAGKVAHMVLQNRDSDPRKELLLFGDGLNLAVGVNRATTETFQDINVSAYLLDLNSENSFVRWFGGYELVEGTGVVGGTFKAPVPAVYDLDGDGDDDLFAAGHPSGAARAMIFLGDFNNEEVAVGINTHLRAWLPGYTVSVGGNSGQLDFEIPTLPATGPAAAATHVRITVWTQAEGAAHMNLASEQSIQYDLDAHPPWQSPSFSFTNLSALGDGWIHLESTFLQYDAGGTVMLHAFPAYHEKVALEWFGSESELIFWDGTVGVWGPPKKGDTEVIGGVGGTSGRPPSTPPSGGGG